MPQKMIGPRARLTEGIDVGAAEEIGLHVHLLDRELTPGDALVDPLVRGVEAPRVADHADEAGALLQLGNGQRVGPVVGERYLDLHVLARLHAGSGLGGVQLGRAGENGGFHARETQGFGQVRRGVRHTVLLRDGTGRVDGAPDERHHLDVTDGLDGL